jgi:hypothetical protein
MSVSNGPLRLQPNAGSPQQSHGVQWIVDRGRSYNPNEWMFIGGFGHSYATRSGRQIEARTMPHLVVALIAFAGVFGSALPGLCLRPVLPEHHLHHRPCAA